MNKQTIYIAADHGGFELKQYLVQELSLNPNIELTDLGAKKFDTEDDYPDFAFQVAKKVSQNTGYFGILICGSGHGVCIAANKVNGVRATIGYSIEGAELARRDDNVNVLCLAGRIVSPDYALAIVNKFLNTAFRTDSDKYLRRINKITALEHE